jgi:Ca2+-binding EF-hand superfamily protein
MLQFIDTDKNGKINYTEFISCCLENSVIFREENLKAAFRLLDRDGNGRIEREELLAVLKGNC